MAITVQHKKAKIPKVSFKIYNEPFLFRRSEGVIYIAYVKILAMLYYLN